jgi:hypothetical protein
MVHPIRIERKTLGLGINERGEYAQFYLFRVVSSHLLSAQEMMLCA